MERLDVIQALIDGRKFATYLEIGVLGGYNFFKVKCDTKIAVDPHFQFNWKGKMGETLRNVDNLKAFYCETTSDDFFENDAPRIFRKTDLDVCLIDGMHEFDFALRDVMNALDYLADNGVIVMHDCNPQSKESAVSYADWKARNSAGFWNGDVWRVIPVLRKYRADLQIHTIATAPAGLCVIRGLDPDSRVLADRYDEIVREFREFDYATFERDRDAYLNPCSNDAESLARILD